LQKICLRGQTAWDYVKGTNSSPNCCRIAGISGFASPNDDSFSVVPNPAQETATVYYTLPAYLTAGTINIADLNGNVIKSIPVSSADQALELDCKSLSNGMYFYSLNAGGKTLSCKKLVIAK
jgi:hypothetical protein